jgi:hypothetical protein
VGRLALGRGAHVSAPLDGAIRTSPQSERAACRETYLAGVPCAHQRSRTSPGS